MLDDLTRWLFTLLASVFGLGALTVARWWLREASRRRKGLA